MFTLLGPKHSHFHYSSSFLTGNLPSPNMSIIGKLQCMYKYSATFEYTPVNPPALLHITYVCNASNAILCHIMCRRVPVPIKHGETESN